MSYDLGTARGTIRLDYDDAASPKANSAIGNIGDKASSVGSRIAGVFGKAFGAVSAAVGLAGTFSIAALAKTGIEYNSLEQTSRAAFKTILGSSEAAADMMAKIGAFGKTSPFPRQAFISATQQMLGFGISADKTIPILKSINDATAAMGGNAETIASFSNIFSKIQSNGKITGEEIARMGDLGINAVQMLADASGKTGAEIRKSIQDGSIDAETAITQLTDQMNKKFAGASENVKNTFPGAIDRVKGAWRDLASAIVDPFVTKTGGGLGVDAMNALADRLRVVANLAPEVIALFTTGNFTGSDKWGMEEDDKFVVALFTIREGIVTVIDKLRGAGGAVQGFLGGLASAASPLGEAFAGSGDRLSSLFTTLQGVFGDLIGPIGEIVTSLTAASASLGVSAWDIFLSVLESCASILATTVVPALAMLADYMANNEEVVQGAVAAITAYGAASKAVEIGQMVADQIAHAKAMVDDAIETGKNTIEAIKNAKAMALSAVAAVKSGIAKAKDMAATVALTAMYAKDMAVRAAHKAAILAGAAATGVATAAQWLFNAAMSANPIALIIIGIVALVAAVMLAYNKIGWFKDFVDGAFKLIGEIVSNVVTWIAQNWGLLLTILMGPIGFAIQWIIKNWSGITQVFSEVWDNIVAGAQAFGGFLAQVWDNIVNATQVVVSWFQNSVAQPIGAAFAAIGTALQPVGDMFASIWNFIVAVVLFAVGLVIMYVQMWVSVFQMAVAWISAAMNSIAIGISIVWNTILAFITTVVLAIVTWVMNAWNQMVAVVTTVGATIASVVMAAWNYVTTVIRVALAVIAAVISSIWNRISTIISVALSVIGGTVSRVWNAMVGYVSGPLNRILSTVQSIWGRVSSYVSGVVNGIVGIVSGAFSRAVSAVSSVWGGLMGAVTRGWSAVGSWFGGLGQRILSAVGNIGNILGSAGRMVIDGFLAGLNSAVGAVTDFFNNLTAKIPKIKGPEDKDKKMLRPAGKWILGGFKESLEDEVDGVLRVFRGLNSTIPLTMNAALNPAIVAPRIGTTGRGAIAPVTQTSAQLAPTRVVELNQTINPRENQSEELIGEQSARTMLRKLR